MARQRSQRVLIAATALAVLIPTGGAVEAGPAVGAEASAALPAASSPLTGFTVQVGPEERVYGPTGLTDAPYFSERTPSGKLLGFISNNDSYRATTRNNRKLSRPQVILRRGPVGAFDKCGAWLMSSVYKRTATEWVALYHAEAAGAGDNNRCIFSDDSVVASVGRAVSHDAGQTWEKTGQVITQNSRLNTPKSEDALNGRLVRYGSYLYYFYGASTGNTGDGLKRRLHVARSAVSDHGARGTWKKWHCYRPSLFAARTCGFGGTGNDGLGGASTPVRTIDPNARVIVPNTYLRRSIALQATGTRGFRLWVSNTPDVNPPLDPTDPTAGGGAWAGYVDIYPPVSSPTDAQVDNWHRTPRAKQLYAYPSIVNANGESQTSGQVFYLYYVKLFPGADFPERYLMRRKVTLSRADTSGLHRVALTTYFRKSDGRRRTSSEVPLQKSYRAKGTVGYLLGKTRPGFEQVIECARNGNYLLRVGQCRTGESGYRRVGWISPTATSVATEPIFRCYNRAKNNYFASGDRRCGGFARDSRLGFGLPSI